MLGQIYGALIYTCMTDMLVPPSSGLFHNLFACFFSAGAFLCIRETFKRLDRPDVGRHRAHGRGKCCCINQMFWNAVTKVICRCREEVIS